MRRTGYSGCNVWTDRYRVLHYRHPHDPTVSFCGEPVTEDYGDMLSECPLCRVRRLDHRAGQRLYTPTIET